MLDSDYSEEKALIVLHKHSYDVPATLAELVFDPQPFLKGIVRSASDPGSLLALPSPPFRLSSPLERRGASRPSHWLESLLEELEDDTDFGTYNLYW